LQRNKFFEVTPVEVHFSGFEVNKETPIRYTQMLRVINISDQVQRMVILPPQTKHFDVHYVKQVGFSISLIVCPKWFITFKLKQGAASSRIRRGSGGFIQAGRVQVLQ
jgi:hypothetical protein